MPLIPAVGAFMVAVYELENARVYVQANPCITGWDVPWTGLFITLNALGIVGSIVSVVIAYSFRGTNTRVVAIVSLVLGIVIWFLALVLHSGPYGWECWRA